MLFVDNCTAHPHIKDLESIELIFLPPNMTSEIQPSDHSIIKTMKTYYRKSIVQSLIRAINNGSTMPGFKLTLLDSLETLRWAWESVTPTAISNCFRKAGFEKSLDPGVEDDHFCDLEDPTSDQGEDDLFTELHLEEPCTFEQYLSVGENLQCAPLPDTKDIIGSSEANGESLPTSMFCLSVYSIILPTFISE